MIPALAYFAYREYDRNNQNEQQQQQGDRGEEEEEEIVGGHTNAQYRQIQRLRHRLRRYRYRHRHRRQSHNRDTTRQQEPQARSQSWPLLDSLTNTSLRNVVSSLNCLNTTTNTMEQLNDNGSGDIHQHSNNKNSNSNSLTSKKNNRILALEQDTFRDEVRTEWIRAVFGNDFPKRQQIIKTTTTTTTTEASSSPTATKSKTNNNNSWKGVGLAGISSFVSYTTDLELPLKSPSSGVNNSQYNNNKNSNINVNQSKASQTTKNEDTHNVEQHDEKKSEIPSPLSSTISSQQQQQQQQPSLGMTLSRLSLGLYVRTVRPGSEAWCAGVEENSVLVGINDGELNLLAEPSKSALERIWQYEGYCCSNSINNIDINSNINTSAKTTDTTTNNNDTHATTSSTAEKSSTKMKIRDPVSMTFIRNGKLHKVLFLSDPPYGIDWGPCGKFCLIQRVRPGGIADRAGVRPSSIVAGIYTGNNVEDDHYYNNKNTIYNLDHSSVATVLKEAASSCSQQQQQKRHNNDTIRIQLCFPPSEARSGHWERQQDALEDAANGNTDKRNIGNNSDCSGNSSDTKTQRQQPPRPRIVAELDGVQVRIHPLLGGRDVTGSFRRGSGAMNGTSPSPSNTRRRSSSTSGGIVVSPSSSLSKLADRVAWGEPLSIWRNHNHYHREIYNNGNVSGSINGFSSSSAVEHGHFYRPCPVLENSASSSLNTNNQQESNPHSSSPLSPSTPSHSILDCWNSQQAFIYIVRHHLAAYNEVETRIRASTDIDVLEVLRDIQQDNSSIDRIATLSDVLSSFLLFWMGWLTANENKPLELTEYLLELVNQNQTNTSSSSLAYHMEFLAGALDNGDIKMSLRNLRQQRQQQYSSKIVGGRVEEDNKSDKVILPAIKAVTGTTPTHHQSMQLKESEFDRTIGQRSASVPTQTECTSSTKPQSRRLFKIFRKKKRPTNKMRPTSSNATVTSITSATKEMALSSDYKTASSLSSTSHDEDFSSSKRSISQSSASTNSNPKSSLMILKDLSNAAPLMSKDALFANTLWFLEELEMVCFDIEKSLLHSFSQKFARWALQPWTTNKETALAKVTSTMRERLERCNREVSSMPLLDPIDSSSEPLLSIDTKGCYILPSAHFPLLLTFDCSRSDRKDRPSGKFNSRDKIRDASNSEISNRISASTVFGEEQIYRTTVELVELKGSRVCKSNTKLLPRSFSVHGSVAGSVAESHQSVGDHREYNHHVWEKANVMEFDSRSTWGPPRTLSLRLTETSIEPNESRQQECGYCWIDLTPYWERTSDERESRYRRKMTTKANTGRVKCKSRVIASDAFKDFDEHGDLSEISSLETTECIEIELRITTEILKTKSFVKRSLLYKHDDDVRQEMFAIEFIKSCDRILRSCGLDMKMLTFRSIPVSRQRGFIEWVQGSVPMSEICQPFAGSILAKQNDKNKKGTNQDATITGKGDIVDEDEDDDNDTLSSVAKAGMTNYESLSRIRVESELFSRGSSYVIPNNKNPIQDFLRSLAYDSKGPYKIQKGVMDTFVKSCAGYSVCTYVLGVGDRHLDNLLLHQSGHFFHCDYSFILGKDPKKYLPMRITQDMINGMGGWKSDNFCQFLSLACAAFLTLRRPENVRHLLSLIRLLEGCGLPDLEKTQSIETAIRGVRDRLQLDLNDEEAIVFMEKLIEDSCASKMWIAVDAIHSLAQRF
jgi:hypothetical protein